MNPQAKQNRPIRMLAFFLNGCECGKIIGGAERRFFEISVRLKALGVHSYALEYESLHSERCGQVGYTPIRVKRRLAQNSILGFLRLTVLGSMACKSSKCSIVYVTETDPWGETYWAGLIAPYFVSCLCRKPLAIVFHHIEEKHFAHVNPLFARAVRRATCMAVSKATADDVRRLFQVKDVIVVGNGIDRRFFDVAGRQRVEYDAVFHGRVAEDKGIFELLKAWRIVVKRVPAAKLLLVGGVDASIRERIHVTLRELGIEANVDLSGFVSDRRLVELLKSSRIYVLPSRAEGFSLSAAEAMAVGLPCILPDLPALREFYSSAAIFIRSGDSEKLAGAITTLLSDPGKCEELRKKGSRLVDQFSWETVAEREHRVLSEATTRAGKPR